MMEEKYKVNVTRCNDIIRYAKKIKKFQRRRNSLLTSFTTDYGSKIEYYLTLIQKRTQEMSEDD